MSDHLLNAFCTHAALKSFQTPLEQAQKGQGDVGRNPAITRISGKRSRVSNGAVARTRGSQLRVDPCVGTLRGVTSPLRRRAICCWTCCSLLFASAIICCFLVTDPSLAVIILITGQTSARCHLASPRNVDLLLRTWASSSVSRSPAFSLEPTRTGSLPFDSIRAVESSSPSKTDSSMRMAVT